MTWGGGTEQGAKTFIGSCTVTIGSGIFAQEYTISKFVIDFENLAGISTINGVESEITGLKAINPVPAYVDKTIYGDDIYYYELWVMFGKTQTQRYIIVNSDKTKFTLCDDQDEPHNNGEFILQTDDGTDPYVPISAEDKNSALWALGVSETKLYFEQSFELSGATFLGIQFYVFNNTNVGIKPLYLKNGAETVSTAHQNVSKEGNVLRFTPSTGTAYKSGTVIGMDKNGDFYVTSFYYNAVDNTVRKLVAKTDEPASLVPYNGQYIGSGISVLGYEVVYVTIDGDVQINLMDEDEESFDSTISKIEKVDGKIVATFEQGTLTINADGSITVTIGVNSVTFTKI